MQSQAREGRRGLALLLAGLAMLGPFSVDAYLPAFPQMQATLQASALEVQQTLTAYMLAFSLMMLWHGALSDAFGRRTIILGSLAVFGVASLGCAASHSVEYLWAFRVLQGLSSGAGVVVGRAMIRDCYAGAPAARLLSLVTMIFSVAPALAPIIGGWTVQLLNWRYIFLLMAVYTALLLLVCWRRLPETLPPQRRVAMSAGFLWRSYRAVFRSPLFLLKGGTLACNFAGLFLYVAAAPVFLTHHLQLGPGDFAWQFVPMVSGIFLGALSANKLAGRMVVSRQVQLGFVLLLGAGLFNLGWHLLHAPSLPWSVLPLFVYTFGMSLAAPGITLMVLDLFPHIRGTVASCQSFTQTMLAAAVAGLAAPALSHSVVLLAAGQLFFAATGLLLWSAGRWVSLGEKEAKERLHASLATSTTQGRESAIRDS